MRLAFTSCVLLAAVLVTGIVAVPYASLNPQDLIFCGRQRKLSGMLVCSFETSDFPDDTKHINISGYMGTEWIGGGEVGNGGSDKFMKFIRNIKISRSKASHITFTCAAKRDLYQKNASIDVPMMYPPEEPPYLMINDKAIQGPEAYIPHDGTFKAHCGVNGGLPSTDLTLTCAGHGPVSKNTSVQMSVEKAANGTKCTCQGIHPSDCYDNSTTEVTLIVSQKVEALQCPAGKFGLDCAKDCNCREQCDVKTGECLAGCLPGWKNSDCQQPECTPELCGKHKCEELDNVISCSCLTGYEKLSPLHCEDIDECKQPDICYGHTCVNEMGSYACRCRSGFHNIVPQTCVKDGVFTFETSAKEEESDIFLFNMRSISAAKMVAVGLSTVVIGFIILTLIEFALTIVTAISTFATTKPLKGLHSHMLKNHYVGIYYNEAEDNDINSEDTSGETLESDTEENESSSPSSLTSSSLYGDDEYEKNEENDEPDEEDLHEDGDISRQNSGESR